MGIASEHADLAIVGAGASGLWAAIEAGRAAPGLKILLLERAARPGAKILVSGGGRCNVGNRRVRAGDYSGSTPAAIRRVLAGEPAARSMERFGELGLPLAEEEGGKLYPASQRASSVLDVLLSAVSRSGARLRCGWKIDGIRRVADGFRLEGPAGVASTRRVLLAAGGCSLPKSGSDGSGHGLAAALGHSIARPLTPALSALKLPVDHPLRTISGLAHEAGLLLQAREEPRRRLRGQLLCTHFGLSGPVVLDASRHWLQARARQRDPACFADWLPALEDGVAERELGRGEGGRRLLRAGEAWLPERLRRVLLQLAGLAPDRAIAQLKREERRALLEAWRACPLPLEGARDWNRAEATAGGVPLAETDTATLASRVCPGLLLAGEVLDVDGRLGGFNFQWAWSSGALAGRAAATRPDSYFSDVVREAEGNR